MDIEVLRQKLENFNEKSLNFHKSFCKKILKLPPGGRAVIINGRVCGSFFFIQNISYVNMTRKEAYEGDEISPYYYTQ